jgi:hypothetical protein
MKLISQLCENEILKLPPRRFVSFLFYGRGLTSRVQCFCRKLSHTAQKNFLNLWRLVNSYTLTVPLHLGKSICYGIVTTLNYISVGNR